MQFKHPSCSGPLNLKTSLLPSTDRFPDIRIFFFFFFFFNSWSETQPHRYVASLSFFFSYGESTLTTTTQIPEEISLHRRNNVENPWGILSLFTTRDRFRLNSPFKWLWWHRYVVFLWSRSFFLRWITADPSPWGNFTPPTKHECGETLGDLEPVYDLFPITGENYSHCQKLWHRHVCDITAKQVIFLGKSPRTPPLEGTSLHRRNMSVERPWGILSLFTTCFQYVAVTIKL